VPLPGHRGGGEVPGRGDSGRVVAVALELRADAVEADELVDSSAVGVGGLNVRVVADDLMALGAAHEGHRYAAASLNSTRSGADDIGTSSAESDERRT